ncbi:MAG TPA: tetratricopeptide repeat protein [Gammaproteobacteria bacterium]
MNAISVLHLSRFTLLLFVLFIASGCASQQVRQDLNAANFLHDEAFPESAGYLIESREAVFALNEQLKNHLDRKLGRTRGLQARTSNSIVKEIIQQVSRKLTYDSAANTTASETFQSQTANCLSLSILTYSMAEHLGFHATFRLVDIPEYWEWRDGHALMARHVNLLLEPEATFGQVFSQTIEVDFFAPGSSRRFASRPITESTVLAMFYNNKGTDALMAGDLALAYAYLRAALVQDPSLDMAVSNLGLLYAKRGHWQWAEKNYREAARRNPDNTVSAEGLAMVLKMTGRDEEAEAILARLERQRQDNPYFHYVQGEEAYSAGNWQQAIRSFHRAIELGPGIDQPYFGLAKTYFRMGDNANAETWLRRAEHHADKDEVKQRYRNKIAALTGL